MAPYNFLWPVINFYGPQPAPQGENFVSRDQPHTKKGTQLLFYHVKSTIFLRYRDGPHTQNLQGCAANVEHKIFAPRPKKKQWAKAKATGGTHFSENGICETSHPRPTAGWPLLCPSEMYRDGPHTKIRTWPHTAAPGWCPLLAGNGSGAGPCSRLAILPTGLPEFGAAVAEWRARPRAARLFFTKMSRFQNFRLRLSLIHI